MRFPLPSLIHEIAYDGGEGHDRRQGLDANTPEVREGGGTIADLPSFSLSWGRLLLNICGVVGAPNRPHACKTKDWS